MSYTIKEELIPGLPQNPYRNGVGAYEGVVAHSTATPNATAENERTYEVNNWQNAFVHFFVDWTSIIQVADTKYICWGAGSIANQRYVQIELCETSDPALFQQSYDRYVWLLAYILKQRNLGVIDGNTLVSHDWVSKNLGGTDHSDPIAYLASHNITWSKLVDDVISQYNSFPAPVQTPYPWKQENGNWYYYENGVKKTGWVLYNNKWYYLKPETGAMATEWLLYKNNWYYLDPVNGDMKTGWLSLAGKTYYLNPAPNRGEMFTGQHTINGKVYRFASDGSLIP